jgi:integral membrane protein (TIGR01906 family)
MKNLLVRIGLGLIAFIVPFFLIMSSVKILIQPWYPPFEYSTPDFPPDQYGFTRAERLKWAGLSIDYLNNDAGLSFLADLRLMDGNPLYNERELSHMLDVKNLVQQMYVAWNILALIFVGVFFAAWRGKWFPALAGALANGGKFTITLILCILAMVAVSFDWLFTMFHRLFFTGSTWIFLYSDSLIRLFPIPFWRDAFILMGVFTIGVAVLLIVFGGRAARANKL